MVVLTYHYFSSSESPCYLEVSLESLDAQLRQFKALGQPAELLTALRGITPAEPVNNQRPAIAVTIDDGDRTILDALPVFERHGVAVVLFVPVGLSLGGEDRDGLCSILFRLLDEVQGPVGVPWLRTPDPACQFERAMDSSDRQLWAALAVLKGQRANRDPISGRKLLSFNELQTLSSHPLVTLCPHSMSHTRLSALPNCWAQWEVSRSVHWIEAAGGRRDLFAYPYGSPGTISEHTNAILQQHRIRFAFSTVPRRINTGRSEFVLGRLIVRSNRVLQQLRNLLPYQ